MRPPEGTVRLVELLATMDRDGVRLPVSVYSGSPGCPPLAGAGGDVWSELMILPSSAAWRLRQYPADNGLSHLAGAKGDLCSASVMNATLIAVQPWCPTSAVSG